MQVDPSMDEALAVRWALKLALDLHLRIMMFHSDVVVMEDKININSSIADLEPIVIDCRTLLK